MLRVGLTGNIASGKSVVTDRLSELGATIIDADELARKAVAPGTPALASISSEWGADVLTPDGSLDRAALRHVVFEERGGLEALNAIVHPEVARLRREQEMAARARGDAVVVSAIPLLFERHLTDEFDAIVLVDAPKALRLERLQALRGIEHQDAMNMIAAQMPAELKRARADYVIENTGTLDELRRDVDALWELLTARESTSSLAG